MIYKLVPKTPKGQTTIQEHGSLWNTAQFHDLTDTVEQKQSEDMRWIYLRSQEHPSYTRWVHLTNDDDFDTIVYQTESEAKTQFFAVVDNLNNLYDTWGRDIFAEYVLTHYKEYSSSLFDLYDEFIQPEE